MRIEEREGRFYIPCREWVSVHLDKPIKCSFSTEHSAARAYKDSRRNLTTVLCDYIQKLYMRLALLENVLIQNKKNLTSYDLDDAGSIITDGSGFVGSSSISSGEHSSTCSAIEGATSSDGGADEGVEGADARDFSDLVS